MHKKSRTLRVFQWIVITGVLAGALHVGSALTIDRSLQYKELTYTKEGLDPALDGYTVAFLTDIHGYPPDDLNKMVERLNRRGPDLVLLGGDFSGQAGLEDCLERLAGIDPTDGFFGVEGNHDRADRLRAAMAGQGMVLLENSGTRVRDGLYIAGVEDLWNRSPDVAAAVAGAGANDFVLLLSHNPDVAAERDLTGVDLMLSGHVHGGEVTLFGLWAPALTWGNVSKYGQRFVSGWCNTGQSADLYVSRGIGKHFVLRCFARPQVVIVTLHSA